MKEEQREDKRYKGYDAKGKSVTRKLTIILMVFMLLLMSAFAGCSGKSTDAAKPKTTKNDTTTTTTDTKETAGPEEAVGSMDKTLDVVWWGFNVAGYLPVDDSIIEVTLEEMFNINIENVMVDNYNVEQVNVLLASGIEYDICTLAKSFEDLNELGIIRPVPEEYIIKYLPSQHIELMNLLGDTWTQYASVDGVLYGIPVISVTWKAPLVMGIRTDWIENIGYDPAALPATLDGLEEMLLKLHTDDPDDNGEKDTYALGQWVNYQAYTLGAYGVSDRYWYSDDDGNPVHYAIDENYKEALKVVQRWYDKGIYDPEIITDGRPETTSKILAGTIGGYIATEWAFTYGHAISPLKAAQDAGLSMEMTIIPPVSGPVSTAATSQFSLAANTKGMTFGRNCTDEKLIRLLQVQDAITTDMELLKICNYGVKDVAWVEDEEGYLETTEAFTNESMSTDGAQRYLNYNFNPMSTVKYRIQRDRLEKLIAVSELPVVQPNLVSAFSTDADIEFLASVDSIAEEFFLKAVLGEVDIDSGWDAYVTRWLNAGGKEILDAKQELYDAMN